MQLVVAYNLLLSLLEESIKSVLLDFPPDKLRGILSYSLVKLMATEFLICSVPSCMNRKSPLPKMTITHTCVRELSKPFPYVSVIVPNGANARRRMNLQLANSSRLSVEQDNRI